MESVSVPSVASGTRDRPNASGWKVHSKTAHGITGSDTALSTPSHSGPEMVQSTLTKTRPVLQEAVRRKYENVVVNFVVEGGVTLRAAGGDRFKNFVLSLKNGYEPPSTQTILRRIAELRRIMEPALAKFLSDLPVAISLTLDGWSNHNLKCFYVVTAHWVDMATLTTRNILLTIIDVKCGTGIGQRVGTAPFNYLKALDRDFVKRLLNVVRDNGSDATAAVMRLFQLVNAMVGYEQMRKPNHVHCADHYVQLAVLNFLKLIKVPTKALREALFKIRHSKVMRQQFRVESAAAGLASREPMHQDSPTRCNSSHEMCADVAVKRVVLDSITEKFKDELGRGALADAEWQAINDVPTFLRPSRQVTERLSADRKPVIDLVTTSRSLLVKQCENSGEKLRNFQANLTTVAMQEKLNQYKIKLVQEPEVIAAFLYPQVPKPTDPVEHKRMVDIVRSTLQRRYSAELNSRLIDETESSSSSLFASMFQPVRNDGSTGDEIDKYLSIGAVKSSDFIDVLSWWSVRKDSLPALYQMEVDYCGTPATSTPSERVNSAARREFTSTRLSLLSSVFIMTMCPRSWINCRYP